MTMTKDQFRTKYRTIVKIAERELRWRKHVFRNDPVALRQKVGEMELLLSLLAEIKDELKERMGEEYEQHSLVDVPIKATYQ